MNADSIKGLHERQQGSKMQSACHIHRWYYWKLVTFTLREQQSYNEMAVFRWVQIQLKGCTSENKGQNCKVLVTYTDDTT